MTGMPAFGPTHQDEEIWNIVGFVRRLPEISAEDFRTMETQLRKSSEHEKSSEHLAKGFPRDIEASILVTMHLSSRFESNLDKILTQAGPIPASFAKTAKVLNQAEFILPRPSVI